jgi:uncharacterized RmlC-like cupin family protein
VGASATRAVTLSSGVIDVLVGQLRARFGERLSSAAGASAGAFY